MESIQEQLERILKTRQGEIFLAGVEHRAITAAVEEAIRQNIINTDQGDALRALIPRM